MPWDGTELLVADVRPDGTLSGARTVAGGPEESVAQADWTGDGRLLYASDRTGWWNLYRDGEPVCPRPEEFGGPLWKLGLSWFAPLDGGLIAVLHGKGALRLGVLDPETCEVVDAAGPWSEFTPASRRSANGSWPSAPVRPAPTRWWSWTPGPAGPASSAPRTRTPWTPPTTPSRRSAPSPDRTAGRSTPRSTRRATRTAPAPRASCPRT